LVIALTGALAVMISPTMSWTAAVALHGLALAVSGVAVLVWWLLRNWNW
jgi:hypothetical protein